MSDRFHNQYDALMRWVDKAREGGWLEQADLDLLADIECQSAADLFEVGDRRPLLVGLFGGTGVGKSSLLNRLAGETLAGVGVERPTSREVTLYLHRDHVLATLPAEFPTGKTRIARHASEQRRQVAWIDMPDIDSVEAANRALVFAWLPYIDWLIYVVSPERYRDDLGWQILHRRGHRHHWLFVLNQGDLAQPEQLEEFQRDLRAAGFADARVLQTSCIGSDCRDDFAQLEKLIDAAIAAHGLEELKRLGILARLEDLARLRIVYRARLADDEAWRQWLQHGVEQYRAMSASLSRHLDWPVALIAAQYGRREGRWWQRRAAPEPPPPDLRQALWGAQPQRYLEDLVEQLRQDATSAGIPAKAVDRELGNLPADWTGDLLEHAGTRLRQALARPGGRWQRLLHQAVGGLRYLLPLGVVGWLAYQLVTAMAAGLRAETDFLGLDFLIHGVFLLGLSWLAPVLLYRLLRPSLRSAVRRGLKAGIGDGAAAGERRLLQRQQRLSAQRQQILAELVAMDDAAPPGRLDAALGTGG